MNFNKVSLFYFKLNTFVLFSSLCKSIRNESAGRSRRRTSNTNNPNQGDSNSASPQREHSHSPSSGGGKSSTHSRDNSQQRTSRDNSPRMPRPR